MNIDLIAVPTGGVRYYVSGNPKPATPRVTGECSKNPDPRTSRSREPGNTEPHKRKETRR